MVRETRANLYNINITYSTANVCAKGNPTYARNLAKTSKFNLDLDVFDFCNIEKGALRN